RLINALEITNLGNQSGLNSGDQDLTGLATIEALASKANATDLDVKVDKVDGERLINALEITNLGNQSGLNSGDQDLTGLATTEALAVKVDKVDGERLINALEITNLGNQSGLNSGDQDLTGLATTEALVDALDSKADVSALDGKANIASPTFTGIVAGITSAMVGLENVDNTTDANKAISTLTQIALNDKADATDLVDEINRATAKELELTNNLDNKENSANKSTDVALGSSDDLFPTQNAVRTYVDTKISIASFVTTDVAYRVLLTDFTIHCNTSNGGFLVTFDPANDSNIGKIYVINKTDITNNELSFSPGLKLPDDSLVTSLNYPKTVRVQSDGADWLIIN
ncbi:hypothetical protein, partial [Maribacter arcticus]|uniref:hypothetical protein n=1 Tax=Maribacter arcticus TaxID=561365 RepID=UPI0030025B2E